LSSFEFKVPSLKFQDPGFRA